MKFKLYKEPTLLISALLVGLIVLIYVVATPTPTTKATVDNKVPLPLQLKESNTESKGTNESEASSTTSNIESAKPSKSTNILDNNLENRDTTTEKSGVFNAPLTEEK